MKKKIIICSVLFIGLSMVSILIWKNQNQSIVNQTVNGSAIVSVSVPNELSVLAQRGEGIFLAKCASCHGINAAGKTEIAPPLVHKIYEPSHHGNESFQRAVAMGVRAHHWPFGNMPKVAGVTRAEVSTIITYVRELQRANGID
jgi:cytochrome c|tara:strand:- start:77 stop:508 length:432 start_codon:yes stop_codon:yes gene_type:complete